MMMLTPHFALVPEKEKIMVCFINLAGQEVARAVIKINEPENELAKRAIHNLSGQNFIIGKPVNGSRWSTSKNMIVTAETVNKKLIMETLKKIVLSQNQKKTNYASTIGANYK